MGAMVSCGGDCTQIARILCLLPGDLRSTSEPLRLSVSPERAFGDRSLRTRDRELAMESDAA
jgi:hypothetical protein